MVWHGPIGNKLWIIHVTLPLTYNVVDSVTYFAFIFKLDETPGCVCVCVGGGGGGGVLRFFHKYIWLGPFFGQNFEIRYFVGFSEK